MFLKKKIRILILCNTLIYLYNVKRKSLMVVTGCDMVVTGCDITIYSGHGL